ncbi:MAG: hypothetical protein WBD07_10840 [Vicinamibacterales bacterium]
MRTKTDVPWLAAAAVILTVCALSQRVDTQSLINGFWAPLGMQDNYHYAGGPDPGDFSGLPITPASLKIALQYDADEFEQPELMCRPFMATYAPRTLSTMRFWETLDPISEEQVTIESTMAFAAPHRTIWMPASNRPSPPASAPHTWQGFSTGKWVGNVLWVHTDRLKPGYLQRTQGLPLSDRATLDERIFRYGNILVDIMMISDPAYLSRPFIYSKMYAYIPHGNMDPYPCNVSNQLPLAPGAVPMRLPFYTTNYNDLFVNKGIPLEAAKGGEQTMFPEYQDHLKTLPPNPTFEQLDEEQRKQIEEQTAIIRGKGWADAPAPAARPQQQRR